MLYPNTFWILNHAPFPQAGKEDFHPFSKVSLYMILVSFTRGFAFGLGGHSRILAQPERKVTQTKMAMDHLPTMSVVPSKREFLSLSLSQGPNGPSGQRAVAKAGPSAKKRLTKRSRRWRWPWQDSNVICLMLWREGADKVSGDFVQ